MADFRVDQAAGLRRMLGGSGLQVITFVAGCEGVGRSVTVANLGVALARLGKEVLLIDEHAPGDDIAASFGMQSTYDLLNVVQRELPLTQVLLRPMNGLSILPAAKAARKLGRLSLHQQQTLVDAMSGLERAIDVILVDASMAHPSGFSPFGLVSQETVVVLSGSSASITEAYALIKKVSQAFSRRHFRILVNKVRSQADARSIYENIAQVATQRGVAVLDYAGAVPLDESLKLASQLCRPVLFQAPDSPSATAFRDLAADIQYWQQAQGEQGGVQHFLQQLLHLSQRITPNVLRA
ncbi:MinD/ParA family ATP-binding protein [Azonexus hydrophilus]|uniref:AAA family ATPase n=1 Tax=Azonexus hydrophilus TaxID=418702 RepID=A0ABZ2XF87_9RHOO|nr:AAA family ATPase [Azonexus hydrophilus]MBS4016638.1 AAA family ATPase [Dechloromonas sp.]